MSLFIERSTPSDLGTLDLTVTRLDHICVRGHPQVRGVTYNAVLHFFRVNGEWVGKREVPQSIHRAYKQGEDARANKRYHEAASPAVTALVEKVYLDAIKAFAAVNQDVMASAEESRLLHEIEAENAKVRELLNDVEAHRANIKKLQESVARLCSK